MASISYTARKSAPITLLLLFCFTQMYWQKLNFDITLYGDKVGTMQVEQKDSGDFKVYNMHSKFEAKVLFSKKSSESTMHVVFDHSGNLLYSYYKNVKTDGVITTTANLQNGKLNVVHNGEKSALDMPLNSSSVAL